MKTNLTRLRGRSLRGTRLTGSAPFGKWGTQTLIAGLTQSGLVTPWVIKGAMDGDAFAAYVQKVLVPELQPGTVLRRENDPPDHFLILLILDNLSTHHNTEARKAMREAGCWFLFLPPYSPDPCVAKNSPPDCFLNAPHRSNKRSPGSKPTSGASEPAAFPNSSQPSAKSAKCSARRNAGTTFMLPDMLQHEVETL